jgi:GntR family transcriptional regulator
LDTASEIPAYRQIADQLRALIVEGVLNPEDSLPPVRRLALELGVHFNTVAQAYRTLAEEGFLKITRGRRAQIVGRTLPERADPRTADRFRQRVRELVASVRACGLNIDEIAGELKTIADALEK